MSDANPAGPLSATRARGKELLLRVCSAAVLAPLALGIAYLGGWPFAVFWGLAALVVLWEWIALVVHDERRFVLMLGIAALVVAVALAATGRPVAAVIVLALGALGAAAFVRGDERVWCAGGVTYAGLVAVAPIALR